MFKMGSHYSFRHLKHKLWPKEGLKIKLSDHKKSGIGPIYLFAKGVRNTVGKFSTRATTLL
jgi:hypothetical protein